MNKRTGLILGVVLLLAAMVFAPQLSPLAVVPAGSVGVVSRNGAASHVAEEGTLFKLPVLDKVSLIAMQPQARRFTVHESYTADGYPLGVRVTAHARLNRAGLLDAFRDHNVDPFRQLDFVLPVTVREIIGRIRVADLNRERVKLNEMIHGAVAKKLPEYLALNAIAVDGLDMPDETRRVFDISVERSFLAAREAAREAAERLFLSADIARLEKELELNRIKESATTKLRTQLEIERLIALGAALRQDSTITTFMRIDKGIDSKP